MTSNQEPNGVGSNDVLESKTIQSELKREPETNRCSTIQSSNVSCGDKDVVPLDIPSKVDLDSDTAVSESKPGSIEKVGSDSEEKLLKLASDGISERGRIGLEEHPVTFGAQLSVKKRSFCPDIHNALGYRERNLYFRPVKRSRFSFDDNSRIGRVNNVGPISTNEIPVRSKTTEISASMDGVFDDADDDETFDLKIYKKPRAIRPDLVAAILGSPTKSNAAIKPFAIRPNSCLSNEKSTNDQQDRRRTTSKKPKKKSTEKERMAAVATLAGEVDLMDILPRNDCNFLGKKCFIFTLQHLEWILGEDENSQDLGSRLEARKALARNLKEKYFMISDSDPSSEVRVTDKFDEWKRLIQGWKQKGSETCNKSQFPLIDGPMSIFFPVGTLQFMESINVKVLFDFLCLKKTESGLVVEMFQAWRRKCGLKDVNLLPLAKHLTGINSRIEASLKRKLDANQDFTKWITGTMVILSGAAKEFLVDYSKIFSGTQFIETKTKNLADQLANWRSKTGLPSLKGSGNVAMISAWKTQIKDQLEVEKSVGRIIAGEEIGNELESKQETITLDRSSIQPRKRRHTEQPKSNSPETDKALNSTAFFSECFRDERKIAMFKSVGITTAQGLLDAEKGKNSILLKALMRLKSEQNKGKEIQIPSCISLLYDWSSRVKKKIKDIENCKSEEAGKIVEKAGNSKVKRNWKRKSKSSDPFDALSLSSKEFLKASMNICTASEFLETRTTDVANKFIKWREEKGMPPLKGLGAVASISGWKKLVRKKAAAVGDLSLAELNSAWNTKLVVEKDENEPQKVQKVGPLDNLPDEAKKMLSTETKSNNILSVLSSTKKDVFHFGLETRNVQTKGHKTYLRYLGNDPGSAFDLTVDDNMNNQNECTVVQANCDEKLEKISGRKSYDSLTHGTIELNHPRYNPGIHLEQEGSWLTSLDSTDKSGVSLEEVIRIFVLQNGLLSPAEAKSKKPFHRSTKIHAHSHMKVKEAWKTFNVFEVLRSGKKSYLLSLADPIERGQLVELNFLPLNTFDKSLVENESAKTIRHLIQDRLRELPVALLLELLRYLRTEVVTLVTKYIDFKLNGTGVSPENDCESSYSSSTTVELIVARRRIHWLAVKIYENLQRINMELALRHVPTDLLWTKLCLDKVQENPGIRNMVSESITGEIREELEFEFEIREFNGFASTLNVWCQVAKTLFNKIVDLYAKFSFEFGGAYIGKDLTSELSRLVTESVSNLKNISGSRCVGEVNDVSKITLMYGTRCDHDSKAFPSLQDIKQKCLLRDSSEPVPTINSIEEAQIVATKRIAESDKNETTYFEDFRDAKIHGEYSIDVRWYVDTQILAVALSAIRCGIYISTPEDKNKILRNIELHMVETANTALTENNGKCLPSEDLETRHHRVNLILQSKEQRSFRLKSRSLRAPSSSPFFFGFIWPLLRDEGWRLISGNAPTEISFVPPDQFGIPNEVHDPKDSLARQRSRLARETSNFGLGYVPRLTKRLLIKCFETNERSLIREMRGPGGIPSPSTKAALEEFASSLLSTVSPNGAEQTKIKEIVIELQLLFNKLVPLTFEKEDESHLTEGKQWCDVLDCTYLFKFLLIMPDILQEADLPVQRYSQTISIVHELLAFLSNKHDELFHKSLELPNEEYESEPTFPSRLPSQLKAFSHKNLRLDLGKPLKQEESEDESIETIRPAAIESRMRGKSGVEKKPNVSSLFSTHLDVMEYIQSTEPWKSNKPLKKMISKYYNCLDYGGKLSGANMNNVTYTSEWLYSKLASKI